MVAGTHAGACRGRGQREGASEEIAPVKAGCVARWRDFIGGPGLHVLACGFHVGSAASFAEAGPECERGGDG